MFDRYLSQVKITNAFTIHILRPLVVEILRERGVIVDTRNTWNVAVCTATKMQSTWFKVAPCNALMNQSDLKKTIWLQNALIRKLTWSNKAAGILQEIKQIHV